MTQPLSATLEDFAGKTGPEGARVSAIIETLGVRGFGAAALKLGIILLLPIPFLPRIAGALLVIEGVFLFAGATRLFAPGIGAIKLSQGHVALMARVTKALFGWAEALPRPRLEAINGPLGLRLCALAIVLGGVCALLSPHGPWVVLGLIVLGFGVMEEDGATKLVGAALCLGAGAYAVTMLAGAVSGAPFAGDWAATHAPWLDSLLHPAPKGLMPSDHDSVG
jgi:hypothetical protein